MMTADQLQNVTLAVLMTRKAFMRNTNEYEQTKTLRGYTDV